MSNKAAVHHKLQPFLSRFGVSLLLSSSKPPITIVHRFIRYASVGGLATLIYFGMLAFLVEFLNRDPVLSSAACFLFIVFFVYILSRLYVFECKSSHTYSLPRFLAVSLVGFVLNTAVSGKNRELDAT